MCHVANPHFEGAPLRCHPRGRGPARALPCYTDSKNFRFFGLFQAAADRHEDLFLASDESYEPAML